MVSEERTSIRVKFSKTGSLKYISHLDLSRTMKSAFLRSKLPIWYTMGFNPHPKMVFSLPLSVGTASLCEFMDFYLTEKVDLDEVVSRLNASFPSDLRAIEAYEPTTRFCDIGFAEYEIRFITKLCAVDAAERIPSLFEGDIIVEKTGKAGTKQVNISPLTKIISSRADGDDVVVNVKLSCGENSFVNPKYIIDHIQANIQGILDGGDYMVCRTHVFGADGTTEFR